LNVEKFRFWWAKVNYFQAVTKCRATSTRPKRIRRAHQKRHIAHARNVEMVEEKKPAESERSAVSHPIRTRRQVCKTKSSEQLNQLAQDFRDHCERNNICLPEEDLPEGPQRDRFRELYGSRAKKYAAYLTELSLCYGRLT
ncbi:hypothetical protein COOONC_14880, partial [Cooperia oncophora]